MYDNEKCYLELYKRLANDKTAMEKVLSKELSTDGLKLEILQIGESQASNETRKRVFFMMSLMLSRLGIGIDQNFTVHEIQEGVMDPILMDVGNRYAPAQRQSLFQLLGVIIHNLFYIGACRIACAVSNVVNVLAQNLKMNRKPGVEAPLNVLKGALAELVAQCFDLTEQKFDEPAMFSGKPDSPIPEYRRKTQRAPQLCKHGIFMTIGQDYQFKCVLHSYIALKDKACIH